MKSKKKQKGAGSNTNIISVAVVLLLAAAAIYAYNSFNRDKPIPGLDDESDLDSLKENLFPPEPDRNFAVKNELADADKTIYNPNQPVDPSISSNFGMQYI